MGSNMAATQLSGLLIRRSPALTVLGSKRTAGPVLTLMSLTVAAAVATAWPSGLHGAERAAIETVISLSAIAIAILLGAQLSEARRRGDLRSSHEDALRDERGRLARELHDSVAQELAFILGQSRELAQARPEERALKDIASAAALALNGTRAAIYGLQPERCDLGEAVRARAHQLASRAGLALNLDTADQVEASPDVQHAVLSVMKEAISNAVRHAQAETLDISLRSRGGTIVMRISDDGCGFEPAFTAPSKTGGFGLWSMHERVQSLGGELTLTSKPGQGTTVELEVWWAARA